MPSSRHSGSSANPASPTSIASTAIVVLFLLHALANGLHAWAHQSAGVATTPAQTAFIAGVVLLLPTVAVALILWGPRRAGYGWFAGAMLASLVFGLVFHYVLDTADLCSNVRGPAAPYFRATAGLVALMQALGLFWAALCLIQLKERTA